MKKSGLVSFVPFALFFLLAWGLAVAVLHGGNGSKFATHVDESAPVTELPGLDESNKGFSSADWQGGAYLLNFFASWCLPCRAEHDAMLRLAAAGIPIVGVAYKDHAAAAIAFLRQEGNPYIVTADDGNGRAGIDWGITGVPETYLIDARGAIRMHWNGPLTQGVIDMQLMPLWKKLSP